MENDTNLTKIVMEDDVSHLSLGVLETMNRTLIDINEFLDSRYGQQVKNSNSQRPVTAGYYFNKETRTFHNHLVLGEDGWKRGEFDYDKSNELRKNLRCQLEGADKEEVSSVMDDATHFKPFIDWLFDDDILISREQLLQTYTYIASKSDEYLPGVMYQYLLGGDNRPGLAFLEVDITTTLESEDQGYITSYKPWNWENGYWKNGASSDSNNCKVSQLDILSTTRKDQVRRTILEFLSQHFYTNAISNVVSGEHSLLIPIFDLWYGGRGYGALWGVQVCTFADKESRKHYVENCGKDFLRDLLSGSGRVANAYLKVGLAKFVGEDIRPPYDLIELFVQRLHWIQDWERVTVYEYERKDRTGERKPLYCYKHSKPNRGRGSIQWRWERCKEGGANGKEKWLLSMWFRASNKETAGVQLE